MARRIVGRETPSRSASSTSLASRPPTGISPLSIISSSCVATWKYSGTGLPRSSDTANPAIGSVTAPLPPGTLS